MVIVCYYYFMTNYSIGLVWALRKGRHSACCAGRDTDSLSREDTDSFSSSNAFKNNDALWAPCRYKMVHTEEVGDWFMLPEKEILPTWMNPLKFLRWFRISVPQHTRDKLEQTSNTIWDEIIVIAGQEISMKMGPRGIASGAPRWPWWSGPSMLLLPGSSCWKLCSICPRSFQRKDC